MLARLFASRAFLSLSVIALLLIAAVAGYHVARPKPAMRGYCAEMPDAIGLYEGSDVTIMGVRVGSVTRIQPHGATARVEFEIPAGRRLPLDAGATTLADSLIADRKLALIGAEPAGPGWDSNRCLTDTATPKSLSETFAALAGLAEQLTGTGEPGQPNALARGLTSANAMSAGTGEQINAVIHRLGTVLNSPDAAIGHLGALLDGLASLAHSAATYWPEIKDMLTRLAPALDAVNNTTVPPVLTVMRELRDILPALNDLTVMFGGPLLRKLESTQNLPELIRSGVGSLTGLIELIPGLGTAFTRMVDPATGAVSVAYSLPAVALPQGAAEPVCAAVNALSPGSCADAGTGLVNIPLAQLVLAAGGAQ
ncbi:MlaD family protein [Nocardia inohanensis]|uniref:MlaD family protein n=1 Tax=Nocardia inohanensis TaxID=209246 RepID=UPI00083048F9|nr:MlaD family protein [Nocardia inohanensis]